VVAYARQTSRFFPAPVVEIVAKLADMGDRPRELGTSQAVWGLGMAWQLLRAWFMGVGKTKSS
jgi:hypothetical protein